MPAKILNCITRSKQRLKSMVVSVPGMIGIWAGQKPSYVRVVLHGL